MNNEEAGIELDLRYVYNKRHKNRDLNLDAIYKKYNFDQIIHQLRMSTEKRVDVILYDRYAHFDCSHRRWFPRSQVYSNTCSLRNTGRWHLHSYPVYRQYLCRLRQLSCPRLKIIKEETENQH